MAATSTGERYLVNPDAPGESRVLDTPQPRSDRIAPCALRQRLEYLPIIDTGGARIQSKSTSAFHDAPLRLDRWPDTGLPRHERGSTPSPEETASHRTTLIASGGRCDPSPHPRHHTRLLSMLHHERVSALDPSPRELPPCFITHADLLLRRRLPCPHGSTGAVSRCLGLGLGLYRSRHLLHDTPEPTRVPITQPLKNRPTWYGGHT